MGGEIFYRFEDIRFAYSWHRGSWRGEWETARKRGAGVRPFSSNIDHDSIMIMAGIMSWEHIRKFRFHHQTSCFPWLQRQWNLFQQEKNFNGSVDFSQTLKWSISLPFFWKKSVQIEKRTGRSSSLPSQKEYTFLFLSVFSAGEKKVRFQMKIHVQPPRHAVHSRRSIKIKSFQTVELENATAVYIPFWVRVTKNVSWTRSKTKAFDPEPECFSPFCQVQAKLTRNCLHQICSHLRLPVYTKTHLTLRTFLRIIQAKLTQQDT